MKIIRFLLATGSVTAAFAPSVTHTRPSPTTSLLSAPRSVEATRANFLTNAAILAGVSTLSTLSFSSPAEARGRATLEQSYDRYTPRIIAGGQFFSSDFRKMIEKNDWNAIKAATSDPPKKTKEDRTKVDGGVADRAKLAGQFSNARVTAACELYAAAFSDNSISAKTKKMKEETENLRQVIDGINLAARQALGEEPGGGFFGFGAKKPSQAELSKRVRQLYVEGGNAYNKFIFAANEELPLSLEKLPYLK